MGEQSLFGLAPDRLGKLFSMCTDGENASGTEGEESAPMQAGAPAGPLCLERPSGPASLLASQVGTQIDRYHLLGVLGEGGMGVIYLAEQEHPIKRHVALKVIKPGMDSQRVIARFEAERQALAMLDHPNIAHVLDAGTTETGRPYFVMEYIKGLPITEHCDQNKLGIEDRLRLFAQVCDAIQHAHEKGVIHRDIKPSNILVVVQGDTAIPKVIDFGVARALSQPLTQETLSTEQGQLIGTPEYMSPEHIDLAHEGADTRSDVYSLGVLLYVLLAGVLPFGSESLREGGLEHLRRVVREQDPKTPSTQLTGLGEKAAQVALNRGTDARTLARNLHKELEWIPLKAMRKEREERYQSAAELGQDIQNYLHDAPLIAGPPSRGYRLRKFVKRNRMFVAAAALVTVTIAAGAGVSLVMYVRASVQAQTSQAVSGLLNNTVLPALSPSRSQGGEVTAVSVLDAVSETLEGRFPGAPLTEAAVRHALGVTYFEQDKTGPAAQHLERALDIRRRELGDDDLLTIDSMFNLGNAYRYQGRNAEAEPLLMEAASQRMRWLGEEDDRTLYAKLMLGWNCEGIEKYDRAMQLYEEVLTTVRRTEGDSHPRAIIALYSIGLWNLVQNRYDEAERSLRKAAELCLQSRPADDPFPLEVIGWLGDLYLLQGRYAEAEPVLVESFNRSNRIYGGSHWLTLWSLEQIIYLYALWDRPDEAARWHARLEAARSADAGSLSGSASYDQTSDTYTIRASGSDIWYFFDGFHFAHKTLHGDGSITARIDSVEDIHDWTKAGIMIRRSLEPTSEHASVFITPFGVVAFQYRSIRGGIALSKHGALRQVEFPHWIRLTRRGNVFSAQHSSDSLNWEEIQSGDPNHAGPVEIPMDEAVHIGLAVTSHDGGRVTEARISGIGLSGNVSPVGPFTTSEDVNLETLLSSMSKSGVKSTPDSNEARPVAYPGAEPSPSVDGAPTARQLATLVLQHGGSLGSIRYEQAIDTYTVVGSGKDIWETSDEFHFAYKKLAGDGAIVARIHSVTNTNPWAKAGVMMRDALTCDSEHASVFITPENRVCLQYRSASHQNALSIHTDPNAVSLPHWVRLVREGNAFRAQHSDDGRKWKDLQGSDSLTPGAKTWRAVVEIPMNESIYIGLAVTSHTAFLTAEAKMSHVSVTGNVSPPGEFLWSEDIGFQMIMLPKK